MFEEMLQPLLRVGMRCWIVQAINTARIVGELFSDVFCSFFVDRVTLQFQQRWNFAKHFLGDFLAIVLVETPLATCRLASIHENVEPLTLKLVEVGHEPALLAGSIFLILMRLINEAGGRHEMARKFQLAAKAIESFLQHEICWFGDDQLLRRGRHRALDLPQMRL